jgi:nicotinate-nucleotide adenylyltransferase
MRIGLLGGTFDPPHAGHLLLAKAALSQLELDEVLFLPAFRNPLKKGKGTPAKQRVEMLNLLLKDEPNIGICDIEVTRGGPSYTVDSLSELQSAQPATYWFILGADSLKSLPEWKHPDRLLRMCRLAVAVRPPLNPQEALARLPEYVKESVDILEMPPSDISSTEIRLRISEGKPVKPQVSDAVLRYIKASKLYENA